MLFHEVYSMKRLMFLISKQNFILQYCMNSPAAVCTKRHLHHLNLLNPVTVLHLFSLDSSYANPLVLFDFSKSSILDLYSRSMLFSGQNWRINLQLCYQQDCPGCVCHFCDWCSAGLRIFGSLPHSFQSFACTSKSMGPPNSAYIIFAPETILIQIRMLC